MNNYTNPEEIGINTKKFGALIASKYFGTNSRIKQIQRVLTYLEKRRLRKGGRPQKIVLGELLASRSEDAYYFTAANRERFRIPIGHLENGIEEVFDAEFKRIEA